MERIFNCKKMIEPNSCRFTKTLYQYPHIHDDYEIIFCISGTATAFIDKEQYELTAGEGIFIFPNQLHFYQYSSGGEYGVVVFKPDIVPTFKRQLRDCVVSNPLFRFIDDKELFAVISKMRDEYDYAGDEYLLQLTGYINFLVCLIYPKIDVLFISHKDAKLFEQVIDYCNQNFKEGISVTELAKLLLTNANRISRVFNINMKMSIPQYIESLRFTEACNLLENTNFAVAKVSEEAGFGSIRSMNRAFIRFLNITPKEYKTKIAIERKK